MARCKCCTDAAAAAVVVVADTHNAPQIFARGVQLAAKKNLIGTAAFNPNNKTITSRLIRG